VVVAVTGVVVLVVLPAATGLGWGWLDTLSAGNPRRSLLSPTTGIGVLLSKGTGDGAVAAAHKAGTLLAVAVALGLWIGVRRVGAVRALGLALLTLVLLGPVVQPWYLLWALVPLAAVVGERLAIGLAVSSAVLCLLILPGGRHLIRPPLYGLPAVLVIAAGYAASRSAIAPATERTT
jgi:alpha-1,6-mannosyltransferase